MTLPIADDRDSMALFDLGALVRTLWDRRVLILTIACAIFVTTALYVLVTKPTYTASAAILVDPRDSRATNFDSVLPGLGADSAAIASQVSVIDSVDLLRAVFDDLSLEDDPEFSGRGVVSRLLSVFGTDRQMETETIFGRFRDRVAVEREGLTYVIDVSFRSSDPYKAARIVEAIVARYRADLSGEKETANSEATTLLTDKIGGLQAAVSEADRAVEDFKFRNQIFDVEAGGTRQSQIDQLSSQVVAAQARADQTQTRYDQAVAAGTSPESLSRLSEILSSTATDALRQEYNGRATALATAEADLGPNHPTIARLSAELSAIRRLMAREAERITRELKAARDIAVKDVQQLQSKLDGMRAKLHESDLSQVQLRQLQRTADAARAVLDDFQKRSQQTLNMQGMQISQVRVISQAVPPVQPTWPKPKLLLPVGAFLGLVMGCAMALVLGPTTVAAARLPAKKVIAPQTGAPKDSGVGTRADSAQRGSSNLGIYRLPAASDSRPKSVASAIRREVLRYENPTFLSSMHELLEQIINRLVDHPKPFVLLISSVDDGIERSLAAAFIGIGLQHIKERVLVIEIAGRREGHGPLNGHGRRPVIDSATGLSTLTVDGLVMTSMGPFGNDRAVDQVLIDMKGTFDFAVIVGRPLRDPSYSPALAARTDLSIFALSQAEWNAGAAAWAQQWLSSMGHVRNATMVIEQAHDKPAADGLKQRATQIKTGQKTSAALN